MAKGKAKPRMSMGYVRKAIARLRVECPDLAEIANNLERLMDGAAKGGHARAKKLTKKRRKEIASKAARARWGKT